MGATRKGAGGLQFRSAADAKLGFDGDLLEGAVGLFDALEDEAGPDDAPAPPELPDLPDELVAQVLEEQKQRNADLPDLPPPNLLLDSDGAAAALAALGPPPSPPP